MLEYSAHKAHNPTTTFVCFSISGNMAATYESRWNEKDGDVSLHVTNHKAAISLNNTAVALLSRGYCIEALDTFKDAVKLMRCATMGDGNNQGNEISDDDVLLSLDRANKRSAACGKPCHNHTMANWPLLQVITTQHNPAQVYEVLTTLALDPNFHVAFPMTIDPIGTSGMDDVVLDAGAVLYNYAIAHECLAASSVDVTVSGEDPVLFAEMARSRSHRLLQLAMTILAKADGEAPSIFPGESTCCYRLANSPFLLVRMAIVHSLIHAAIVLNLDYLEYNQYCHAMLCLMQAVEAHRQWLPHDATLGVASAA
jgi:hypothetical protein